MKSIPIHKPGSGTRWLALFAVIFNVAFNYVSDFLPGTKSIVAVTDEHYSFFSPARYAFSIWGIIYLAFIIYAIYQLLPSQRKRPLYDSMAWPFIMANVFCTGWLMAYKLELMGVSLIIIVAALASAILLYTRAKRAMAYPMYSRLLTFPFSMFMSWLSVATIANAAIYLQSLGWSGAGILPVTWAMIMIAVACLLGILISTRFLDPIFPAVIFWAVYAISVEQRHGSEELSRFALMAASVMLLWSICYSLYKYTRHNYFENHNHDHDQGGGIFQ